MADSQRYDIFYNTDAPPPDSSRGVRTFRQHEQQIGAPPMRFVPSMPSPEMRMADVAAELESDPS
jgi:hypothetical protein